MERNGDFIKKSIDPDKPDPDSAPKIKYCLGCDTPLSSPCEFDQDYHDTCWAERHKKSREEKGRGMSTRRSSRGPRAPMRGTRNRK
jgi:hypothetical protein